MGRSCEHLHSHSGAEQVQERRRTTSVTQRHDAPALRPDEQDDAVAPFPDAHAHVHLHGVASMLHV